MTPDKDEIERFNEYMENRDATDAVHDALGQLAEDASRREYDRARKSGNDGARRSGRPSKQDRLREAGEAFESYLSSVESEYDSDTVTRAIEDVVYGFEDDEPERIEEGIDRLGAEVDTELAETIDDVYRSQYPDQE